MTVMVELPRRRRNCRTSVSSSAPVVTGLNESGIGPVGAITVGSAAAGSGFAAATGTTATTSAFGSAAGAAGAGAAGAASVLSGSEDSLGREGFGGGLPDSREGRSLSPFGDGAGCPGELGDRGSGTRCVGCSCGLVG